MPPSRRPPRLPARLTGPQWQDILDAFESWAQDTVTYVELRERLEHLVGDVVQRELRSQREANRRLALHLHALVNNAFAWDAKVRKWECRFCGHTGTVVATLAHTEGCQLAQAQRVLRDPTAAV